MVVVLHLVAVPIMVMTFVSMTFRFVVVPLVIVVTVIMRRRLGAMRMVVCVAPAGCALACSPRGAAQNNQKQFRSHIGLFYRISIQTP